MYKFVLCYTDSSKSLFDSLSSIFPFLQNTVFEAYNESYPKEARKARRIKNQFGAVKSPFCGVWYEERHKKGFYSEVDECTEENIINYLEQLILDEQDGINQIQ